MDKLDAILEKYRVDFDTPRFKKDKKDTTNVTWWEKEKYKWEAVKTFQDNWNIEDENFAAMIKRSLSKTKNLLQSKSIPAASVITDTFAGNEPEETRAMFRDLFDESKDFVKRVEEFKKKSRDLYATYGPEKGSAHQEENAITTYLWLRYPDKYYIYKQSSAEALAKELGYDYKFPRGSQEENLRQFMDFYNEICAHIKQNTEFANLLKSHLTTTCYPDPEYKTLVADLGVYVKTPASKTPAPKTQNYWWLVANPDIWSMSDFEDGKTQFYTLYNGKEKRKIFQNFLDAKVGEQVIGYESRVKKVVAVFEVAAAQDGEKIEFKKIKNVPYPAERAVLKARPELSNMEFFKRGNGTGSLFKLTPNEYDCIMRIVNNPPEEEYGEKKFLEEVFMDEGRYRALVNVLQDKKNIILKGAPGVGKTYAARRLAWSMMKEKDNSRIKLIQFHQNYSYEDFIMGYKPEGANNFVLKEGVFYKFCKEAQNPKDPNNKGKDFFLIIDEINRGNISKIFGELLMLIEKDYRETEKITIPYRDEDFFVPKNLYIIGMMNTADRSLAMIDYALRRRFSHFELEPAFDSVQFKKYQAELGNQEFDALIEAVKNLNREISEDKTLGKGYQIGHSYFCLKPEECTIEKLRAIIDYDILPMLEEYWIDDDYERVETWKNNLYEAIGV